MSQVLTANRLGPGEVVYWSATKGWTPDFAQAEIMDDAVGKAALEGAAEWIRRREVVGAYLFEVRVEEGKATPVKAREVIRAAGPTVRRDLGKQASGAQ
ncbi:MAG: hypothetical protein RJB62_54 [Pseudomonadota bacterium]|jgi:hypothetical protein